MTIRPDQHGTDPRRADSNSDSNSDGWEIQHGLNPLQHNYPDADNDGVKSARKSNSASIRLPPTATATALPIPRKTAPGKV